MQAGSRMVTESGADLGIVFDTDVDRSAVVARDGEAINSNRYIALMSYIALRRANFVAGEPSRAQCCYCVPPAALKTAAYLHQHCMVRARLKQERVSAHASVASNTIGFAAPR